MKPTINESSIHFLRTSRLASTLVATLVMIAILFSVSLCRAESDLEDKISKYKDDAIGQWDELGDDSVNISFIIVKALGRINMNGNKDVNINSVVVGPGSNVGDIYNIHLNEPGGLVPSQTATDDEKDKD
jgi:hypothetical protein